MFVTEGIQICPYIHMQSRAWDDIKQLLLPVPSQVDRKFHHSTWFQAEAEIANGFICKTCSVRAYVCWMYSVEWRKRWLLHAHILIWLYYKFTPNEIDNVISGAEIPYLDFDKLEVVRKNIIKSKTLSIITISRQNALFPRSQPQRWPAFLI